MRKASSMLLAILAVAMGLVPGATAGPGVEPLRVGPRRDLAQPASVPHEGYAPAVAANGDLSLVVWLNLQGVFAQRVDEEGLPLEPTSIFLAPPDPTYGCRATPTVNWGDGAFLVTACGRAFLVTPDGAVFPIDPLPGQGPNSTSPVISWDGAVFLVVWAENGDIYGSRVGADGAAIDVEPFLIVEAERRQWFPSVASIGDGFLVVWEDERLGSGDVYAARVSSEGEVLDPEGYVVSNEVGEQGIPKVAASGSSFMVAWVDGREGKGDVYASRIGSDGTVLDPGGLQLTTGEAAEAPEAIASDGTDYVVLVFIGPIETPSFRSLAVSADGGLPEPDGHDFPGEYRPPHLAWNGTGYQSVYTDRPADPYSRGMVWGLVLSRDGGPVTEPEPLSLVANMHTGPAIAWDGQMYLAAWRDGRRDSSTFSDSPRDWDVDIYVGRISAGGDALDGSGILIRSEGGATWPMAVGAGGGLFLVVWEAYVSGQPRLEAVRVRSDGVVLDGTPLIVRRPRDNSFRHLDVAWSGSSFVLAWTELVLGRRAEVFAARVMPDGGLPDGDPVRVTDEIGDQTEVSLASTPQGVTAVWRDDRSGRGAIYGARLREERGRLVVRDPDGLALFVTTRSQSDPDVAAGGGIHLVTWDERESVFGVRVSSSGQPLDDSPISIAVNPERTAHATVVWTGASFVVSWLEKPDSYPYGPETIRAARVSPAGEVLDPASVGVEQRGTLQSTPAPATTGGPGWAAVVYTLEDVPDLTDGAYGRSFVRFLQDPEPFDLAMGMEDSPDPVVVGHELTYALRVRNQSHLPTSRVIVTDDLPETGELVSASPSQGRCSGDDVVRCNLGTLGPGAAAIVEIVVRVTPAPDQSEIINGASVIADEDDPDVSDNSASEVTLILPDVGCTRWGTPGDDELAGTNGPDVICGLAGNDHIFGRLGEDVIHGGYGNDTLTGNDGADELHGNPGDDSLLGSSGNDSLFGERGFDSLDGGSQVDQCDVGPDGGTTFRCE